MLRQPATSAPPLDYFRPSPVRGQLEPWDPTTAKGWRYLQTTDTLDEFKVLLPSRTALMYEQLLRLEVLELGKGSSLSWQKVVEIRRLKDRMIRKCHRLPGASSHRRLGRTGAIAFQTIVAPADFRLKEMEKWFKLRQPTANAVLKRHNATHPDGVDNCSKCASRTSNSRQKIESKRHSKSKASSLVKALPAPEIPPRAHTPTPLPTFTTLPMPVPAPATPLPTPDPAPLPVLASISFVDVSTPRSNQSKSRLSQTSYPLVASSPAQSLAPSSPPLPHPYRHQRLKKVNADEASNASKDESRKQGGSITGGAFTSEPLETVVEEDRVGDIPTIRPRRRSCIKRSSIGDLAKTVSWADDDRPPDALVDQSSDAKWQAIREIYDQQMSGLESLQTQVIHNLEQLRAEVAQLENIDATLRSQRENMKQTMQGLEATQTTFQEKMREVVAATNTLKLSLSGNALMT